MNEYKLIDLFCGCGGMTLGFQWDKLFTSKEANPACRSGGPKRESPFRSVWANDFNQHAIDTYAANFDQDAAHSRSGPIEDILDSDEFTPPRADVVIGGPPCQGFSLLNKKRLGDPRRTLWWRFMQVAAESQAKIIVMENVPLLLNSDEFLQIQDRLRELGFRYLMAGVLCAADYGVAQTRQRAVIMASRSGPIALPTPIHLKEGAKEKAKLNGVAKGIGRVRAWRTVENAFNGLPEPQGTEFRKDEGATLSLHFGRSPTPKSLERYRAVPPGGNRFDLQANRPDITPACWIKKKSGGTDLFGRLWWNRPSVTIRTEFFKPEKGRYLHPESDRPITHREAARIQSFPDRFAFQGSKIEVAKQIGNAVPPLLAHRIALEVERSLNGETTVAAMETANRVLGGLPNSRMRAFWDGSSN